MAWPSGSKAGITHLDQGSDRPSLARADIKQNVDNVNSIIDHLNISSPSNGDLLKYSSSTGKWEQIATSANQPNIALVQILANSSSQNVSSNIYRRGLNETFDPNGIVAVSSTYQLTLGVGNYIFETMTTGTRENDDEVQMQLYDETNGAQLGLVTYTEIGTTNTGIFQNYIGFTAAGTINISFRQDSSSSSNRDIQSLFKITKFA